MISCLSPRETRSCPFGVSSERRVPTGAVVRLLDEEPSEGTRLVLIFAQMEGFSGIPSQAGEGTL